MKLKPLRRNFVLSRASLLWREAVWGVDNGWVDWLILVDLAVAALLLRDDASAKEVALAGMVEGDREDALEIACELADAEPSLGLGRSVRDVWRFLALLYLYENRTAHENPLEAVEGVYADFGYPPEMAAFIRYMPPSDGYDPRFRSIAENENRLVAKWGDFLAAEKSRFKPGGGT